MTDTVLSSTEIMVQWSAVLGPDANGVITNYEVQFLPHREFEGYQLNGSVITDDLSIVLADLQEFVEYDISVRAYTSAGAGPYSEPISIRTMDDGERDMYIELILCVLYVSSLHSL